MDIIPIFSTDASISKSILTANSPQDNVTHKYDPLNYKSPVSVFTIAHHYNIKDLYICDSYFYRFINLYNESKKQDINLRFGIKFVLCNDSLDLSEASLNTENKVCVWALNTQGYSDLCKIYSRIHGDEKRLYYIGRGDWKLLQELWTDNLALTIPFYSSFLHKNMLCGDNCVPFFGQIKPIFELGEYDLPFDNLLKESVLSYCKDNKFETLNTHQCYYYAKDDLFAYQVYKCNTKVHGLRSNMTEPKMEHFSSDGFSFEKYCELSKIKFMEYENLDEELIKAS